MAVREYDAKAKLWLCDTCGEWNLPEDDICQVCDDPKHLPLGKAKNPMSAAGVATGVATPRDTSTPNGTEQAE